MNRRIVSFETESVEKIVIPNQVFLLFGMPGAGKGTLTKGLLDSVKNIKHISTGDIFRQHIKTGTELGKQVKSIIDSGSLVPDEVTLDVVATELLPQNHDLLAYALDGFPRTVNQAKLLLNYLDRYKFPFKNVLYLKIDEDTAISRLSDRLTCRSCSASYSTTFNPPENGACKCGGELYQRADDTPEGIYKRLNVYKYETAPVLQFLEKMELLKTIDCNGDNLEERKQQALQILNSSD